MTTCPHLDQLGQRSRPVFGQLTLAMLLVCGAGLACYFLWHWQVCPGTRQAPVTVLSWLPEPIRGARWPQVTCGLLYFAGALLWLGRIAIPWSGWLTTLAFTGVIALYLENANQVTHVAHLTSWLLVVHALWYQFAAAEIRAAGPDFWQTPLYPRWVHGLSIYSIGVFYGWAGLCKLWMSGLGWANGISLQLWASVWGDPDSLATQLILQHRSIAVVLQWSALLAECAAPLAVLLPRLRLPVGMLLVGFHVGQIAVFGWGFHANMVVIGLFFFPVEAWVNARPAASS